MAKKFKIIMTEALSLYIWGCNILNTAMDELDLSRTKLLVSIRRLIEKERLSKVRSSKDERKIYIYLNNDDISKFNALFEDVEQFLNI